MPQVQSQPPQTRLLRDTAAHGLRDLPPADFLHLTSRPLPRQIKHPERFRLGVLRVGCLRQARRYQQASDETRHLLQDTRGAHPDDLFMLHCEATRSHLALGHTAPAVHHLTQAHTWHGHASPDVQDYLHVTTATLYAALQDDPQQLLSTRLAARTPSDGHPYHLIWNEYLRRANLAWILGMTGYTREALKLATWAMRGLQSHYPHSANLPHLQIEQLVFAAREGTLTLDDPQFQSARHALQHDPDSPLHLPLHLARAVTARASGEPQAAHHALQDGLRHAQRLNIRTRFTLLLYEEGLDYYREHGPTEQATQLLKTRIALLEERREHTRQFQQQLDAQASQLIQLSLENALSQTRLVEHLSAIGEHQDDQDGGHTRRVASLTYHVARQLKLQETQAHDIATAACLHDLGKISVPGYILQKPGPLTPEERAQMQTHTEIGAQLLDSGQSDVLKTAQLIARHHHERWDGSGYPDHLRGEQIPLPARITAVADVFDALTSERPYKTAWTPEAALTEIIAQSGRHFDPNVVDALAELLSDPVRLNLATLAWPEVQASSA